MFRNKWSDWKDLKVGKLYEYVYLLQYRRHKNGRVQFRVEKSEGIYGIEDPSINDLKETK